MDHSRVANEQTTPRSRDRILAVGLVTGFGASAALLVAEPDNFAVGTDIRSAFPGITLSVQGKPASEVRAVDSYSAFDSRLLATSGTLVFGQSPQPSTAVPQGWDEVLGLLRVDFASPANFVQIDLIYDDDDVAALWAYDSAGVLLDMDTFYGDGRGPTPDTYDRASITRPQADIAYILAGGRDGEAVFLDNLQVRLVSVPTPTVFILKASGAPGRPSSAL